LQIDYYISSEGIESWIVSGEETMFEDKKFDTFRDVLDLVPANREWKFILENNGNHISTMLSY